MWFQPCASLLRSRNVFLSSTTFVDETRGVAYSIQNLRFVTSTSFLYISLTVHLVIILCLWPTRSTFLYLYLLHLSNVSSTRVLIIRRSNCVNTSSGMIGLCERLLGMTGIPSSHSDRPFTPDDVLTQFDLLMISTVMLETCREVCINKDIKKCVTLVICKEL